MGNNNSSIDVTFDRPQPTIYYTGDIISGHVHFIIPQGTNNIDDIYLTVTGDVGYTTIRTIRIQNGMTDRVTDRHDITIFREKLLLSQAALNERQRSSIRRTNDTSTLAAGEYTYPFSIQLPDVLPPTIHPKDYPFVRYQLQLFMEKKWYCANTNLRFPLRIYPRIDLLQITNANCAVKFDTRHKDMYVKGVMQRSAVLPGDQIDISIDIYNPSRFVIKNLDICLIQRYEIDVCRRRLELFRLSIPQFNNINDEHIQTVFPIILPMGISPTYNYRNKIGRTTIAINIHYDIKVDIKMKGLFTDFDLQFPIIIGTNSGSHLNNSNENIRCATVTDLNAIDLLELQVRED